MPRMTRREWNRTAIAGLAATALGARPALATKNGQGAAATRSYRYVHLDVFTNRPLVGNQLAVFLDPAGLDADTMQGLAREMNYSESTFVFPAEDPKTDLRVRIFTGSNEMPFAGHPVVGTAFALAHAGRIKPGTARVVFGLGAGPTTVDLEWRNNRLIFAWMTQQRPIFGKTIDDLPALAGALGVEASAVPRAAQEISCGSTFLIVPLTTRQAVDGAALNRPAMEALYQRLGMTRRGSYVFTTERGADDATSYSRLLGFGASEDPATGSAAGPLGCYLVRYGLVPAAQAGTMINVQGVKVRRPSRIHISIAVSGGDISVVRVGGESVVLGEGTVQV